jgi:release factor glutamine methyltransferase
MAEPSGMVWTIGALLQWTEKFFSDKRVDSPRLDAQILLAHCLNCRRTDLYVRHDDVPSDAQRAAFRELVKKRAAGTPVAYLVGSKEFFLLPFVVTPNVLIPRPATETLVMTALELMKGRSGLQVLDIGTGSGCIAVTIAVRQPQAQITALDISAPALQIAQRNAEWNKVAERIRFVESDLFSALSTGQSFDFILTNPPYISASDIAELATDVRDHEPRLALDGGPDGLRIIERILADAGRFLAANGRLLIEIGYDQAEAVRAKADSAGWKCERIVADSDRIPRVVVLSIKS